MKKFIGREWLQHLLILISILMRDKFCFTSILLTSQWGSYSLKCLRVITYENTYNLKHSNDIIVETCKDIHQSNEIKNLSFILVVGRAFVCNFVLLFLAPSNTCSHRIYKILKHFIQLNCDSGFQGTF